MHQLSDYAKLFTLCSGVFLLSACIDNDYDLSDIDTTIKIGNDQITLPTSSTGDITLHNIFDINDGSAIVEQADGSYFVNTEGNTDPSNVKIDVISIKKPNDESFNASIDLRLTSPSTTKKRYVSYGATEFKYYYDISNLAKANINNAKASDISADVIEIDKIGFQKDVVATIEVTVDGDGILEKVHFDDLKLKLPEGFNVKSCEYNGVECLNSAAEKTKATDDGEIVINASEDTEGYTISATKPIKIQVTFTGANVETITTATSTDGLTFNSTDHSAELKGLFQLTGSARIINDDINFTTLKTKYTAAIASLTPAEQAAKLAILTSGNYQEALNEVLPKISFDGNCKFNDDLKINTFSGLVQHEIGNINPIELNDLPDFLTDDDGVTLDLSNPQIFLNLKLTGKNGAVFNQKIETGIKLEAFKDGSTDTKTATASNIIFDASSNTSSEFTILKRAYSNTYISNATTPMPEEYESYRNTMEGILIPELATFLNKVPNRVEVKGSNSDNILVKVTCTDLKLPQDCDINLDYKVYTPLSFGNGFKIVYKDKDNGWGSDLEDLEDMDFGGISITAKVDSDLPLAATLSLVPIDINEEKINGLNVNSIKINPNAKNQSITLDIKPSGKFTMQDFFKGSNGAKKLDGIRYEATLDKPVDGSQLKGEQKLKLHDLKISLVGGITISDL